MVSIRKTVGFVESQLHCVCRLLRWQALAIVQDRVGLAAHLNHYWEMVNPEKQDHQKALLIVGFRFAYTTVFGWYAAYLYLRTGHLVAPIVAHVFCNVMGLPAIGDVFGSSHCKVLGLSFLAGLVGFICLLQPATSPSLYNNVIPAVTCNCWLSHCNVGGLKKWWHHWCPPVTTTRYYMYFNGFSMFWHTMFL